MSSLASLTLFFCLALCGLGVRSFAQTLLHGHWVTDSSVYDAVRDGKLLYLGGAFTYLGPNTGALARVHSTTGKATPGLPPVHGTVRALVTDSAGGLIVGGSFTRVADQRRQNLARLLPDGTLDSLWAPAVNGEVLSAICIGNKLYLGGAFTEVNGKRRNKLAALHIPTAALLRWNPDVPIETDTVYMLATFHDSIVVGGSFRVVGGEIRKNFAVVDSATGLAGHADPAPNAPVLALQVVGAEAYIGGLFSTVGPLPRKRLACIDLRTGYPTPWQVAVANGPPASDTRVQALCYSGGKLYIGGRFAAVNGEPRQNLAAWHLREDRLLAWHPAANGPVHTLHMQGSALYAAGYFREIGGEARSLLAALDVSSARALPWQPFSNAVPYAFASAEGAVWVGGAFSSLGGVRCKYLAVLEYATGRIAKTSLTLAPNGPVHALALHSRTLYLGGEFTALYDGRKSYPTPYLAGIDLPPDAAQIKQAPSRKPKLTPRKKPSRKKKGVGIATPQKTTAPKPVKLETDYRLARFAPQPDGPVYTLSLGSVQGDAVLYAAGTFLQMGGANVPRLAALQLPRGRVLPRFAPTPDNLVLALLPHGDTLFVGGRFATIAGVAQPYLAALHGAMGQLLPWEPQPNDQVNALALYTPLGRAKRPPILYTAGRFTLMGGQARARLAAFSLSAAGAVLLPYDAGSTSEILALALQQARGTPQLFASGRFTFIGNRLRRGFATLDATEGLASDWNPGLDKPPTFVALIGRNLYLSGSFTRIADEARKGLAVYRVW